MGWFTAVVLYLLIWWVALFAVLPIGTRPDAEPDAASGWRGAPIKPRLGRKLIATSLVAAVVWGGCVALVESDLLSFRHGWLALHDE
jgi:predicted secreted protein